MEKKREREREKDRGRESKGGRCRNIIIFEIILEKKKSQVKLRDEKKKKRCGQSNDR